jgi:hypothetical protein
MHQYVFVGDEVVVGVGDFEIIDGDRADFKGNLVHRQIIAVGGPQQMAGFEVFGLDPAGADHPERVFGSGLNALAACLDDNQAIDLPDEGLGHLAQKNLPGMDIPGPDNIPGLDILNRDLDLFVELDVNQAIVLFEVGNQAGWAAAVRRSAARCAG